MTDLFADAATERAREHAPLAARMRPHSIEDLVGHETVVGPGTALRQAIEHDRVRSTIFHGPPGSGKTTLARIVATSTAAAFEELSAVSASVADVRSVIAAARERLGAAGRRTVLFLDEIHRFNKAQQDALLPAVEDGTITLLGATTENPYFEINAALLSRCQVYALEPLGADDIERIVARGARVLGVEIPSEAAELIAAGSGGDARSALAVLELAAQAAAASATTIGEQHVRDAARKRPISYDKGGDRHYDLASALIKAIRGSDVDATVYYLACMLAGGDDARFIARRLVVHASEDIGLADPHALPIAVAAAHAVEHVGLPEARINLAHAAMYLARAPKSNSVIRAIDAAGVEVRERGIAPPPLFLRDGHSAAGRARGHGDGYRYPPDDPDGYAVDYLPEALHGKRFYRPSGNGDDAGAPFGRTERPISPAEGG